MCCTEAVPFAKTGGMADVIGALPFALKKLGVDCRVIIPYYTPIFNNKDKYRFKLVDEKVNQAMSEFEEKLFDIYSTEYNGIMKLILLHVPVLREKMKIIAFIEDYKVVKKILDHLGIYEFDKKRTPSKVAEDPDEFDEYIIDDFIDSDHVC